MLKRITTFSARHGGLVIRSLGFKLRIPSQTSSKQMEMEAEVGTTPAENNGGDMAVESVGCLKAFWANLTRKDLKHFQKFVTTTATHGVRRMFTGKSRIRRLFWILLFLAATVGCVYNISTQIMFLAGSPTTTEVRFERRDSLPFPAVTICNQSPLNQTALDEKYNASVAMFFSCAIDTFYAGTGSSNATNVHAHIDSYCGEKSGITSAELQLTISDILKATAFEAEKFIVRCSYNGDASFGECSYKNFTQVATNNGHCYTFNQNFLYRCEGGHNLGSGQMVNGAGQRFGLSVWVNIDQANYPTTLPYAGALIELHRSEIPPRPLQLGFSIPPGLTAFAGLQFRKDTFSKCRQSAPQMNFYDEYTISTCVLNNLFTRVANKCGCIAPGAPSPCPSSSLAQRNITAQCTLNQMGCYFDAFLDISGGGGDDNCEQECSSEEYASTLSYASFPATMYMKELAPNNSSTNKQNLVALEVYFEDLVVQLVDEQPAYDAFRLIADIGGQLGLFLGVSLLSVTEFLTWLLDEAKDRLLFCKAARRKSRRNELFSQKKKAASAELVAVSPMSLKAAEIEQEKPVTLNGYANE